MRSTMLTVEREMEHMDQLDDTPTMTSLLIITKLKLRYRRLMQQARMDFRFSL